MSAERGATVPANEAFAGLLAGFRVVSDADATRVERESRALLARPLLERLPRAIVAGGVTMLGRCHPRVTAAVRAWRPDAGGLVLLGPTGAGKSTGAAFAFLRVVHLGIRDGGEAWAFAQRVRWTAATDLEAARNAHPRGKGDEAPEIIAATMASVLVVDDGGEETDPTATRQVLADRYDAGFPTILTSNLGRAALSTFYGAVTTRKLTTSGGKRAELVDLVPAPGGAA